MDNSVDEDNNNNTLANDKVLVLISGHKDAGKDTAGKLLINEYGFTRFAFADKLKDECSVAYDVPRYLFEDEYKDRPIVGRGVSCSDSFSKRLQEEELYTHFKTFKMGVEPFKYIGPGVDDKHMLSRHENGPYSYLMYNGELLHWTPRAMAVLKGSTERTVDMNHWVDPIAEVMKVHNKVVGTDWRYKGENNRCTEIAKVMGFKIILIRVDDGKPAKSNDASETQLDNFEYFDAIFDNSIKNNTDKLYSHMRTFFNTVIINTL
jgi:hypothetical protein